MSRLAQREAEAPAAFDHKAALAGCATGDARALKALYEREAAALLGVAQRILRRRDLAEEVLQETFVQIWRKAATYDPTLGSARGWVYAILRNRALNALRDERHVPVDDDTLIRLSAGGGDGEDAFARLAEESALRRCLDRLDPKRRASIVLAYVRGYSHGEIAGSLGVPLGTVKAWIRRSLAALRDCLA